MSERINILTHDFYPRLGGIAVYIDETARAAVAAGHEVTVWAPGKPELQELEAPYRIEPLPVAGTQGLIDRLRLRRHLLENANKWTDSLLYLPEPGPLRLWIYDQTAGLPHPRRLVVTLHGSEINTLARFRHRHAATTAFLNRCERIGFVSRAMEALFRARFPEVSAPRVLVPGALRRSLSPCAASPADRSLSPLRVLTVARVHPRKGHDLVVRAIARLPEELRRRVIYEMVGPVSRPAYLRKVLRMAEERRVAVNYLGAVDEPTMIRCLEQADVFVLAARELSGSVEGLGLAILEAQAAGVPVVATNSGGVGEAVAADRTALLVAPDDPDALAAALARVLGEDSLRRKLGLAGPDWVRENFSWAGNVGRLFGP